jgi:hypothetical protein
VKGRYETGDRLGCQVAHTEVETIKKWAVKLLKFLMYITQLLYHRILGRKKCDLCNAGITAKLSLRR